VARVRHLRDDVPDLKETAVAAPSTPAPSSTIVLWQGRVLLRWARFLQHTVASKDRRKLHVARRNAAMRAAHARGIDREAIARATGLKLATVKQALRGEPTAE
jgi:hypothetical protein